MQWWKCKDTEYGGIMYRSKLEARWAEFFDIHGIRHKYEPERVDLGIDIYIPDFWLPEFKLWVEIKPFRQFRPHSKCFRLAIESKRPVLLIQRYPEEQIVDIFSPNARRKFTHRTVIRNEEIKPSKEYFRIQGLHEGSLVLTSSSETIRFRSIG